MSWAWDATDPKISSTYTFLTTAKAIWDSIRQTYSKARDATYEFEIKVGGDQTR